MRKYASYMFDRIKFCVGIFLRNNCSMHAAGLTYFTLLAVIPMLCCTLVVARFCGVDRFAKNQINAHIDYFITSVEKGQRDKLAHLHVFADDESGQKKIAAEYFAKQAREVSNSLFERIESFDISTFGWAGFLFLLWTLVSSLGMVEASFNGISSVDKPRPIWKRLYAYAFVIVFLPILVVLAMSVPVLKLATDLITAISGSVSVVKPLSEGLLRVLDSFVFRLCVSLASSTCLFTFFFWAMPNCKLKIGRCLPGAFLTAVLFSAWLKLCTIAQIGISRSSALYGSFAFFPIIVTWIYMSWQIVLFGFCFTQSENGRQNR